MARSRPAQAYHSQLVVFIAVPITVLGLVAAALHLTEDWPGLLRRLPRVLPPASSWITWRYVKALRAYWAGTRRPIGHRQRGQSYVEFIMVLPLFLVIIAGVIGFGRILYAKLAVEAAAWSGARHAVATLDHDRGVSQAYQATRHTLSGFALNPASAETQVIVWGQWGRGTQVAVRVCYEVPPPPVPMGDALVRSRICAEQTMPVYRWKAEW